MAFPLIPVAIGALVGAKGPALLSKVKGWIWPETSPFDPALPESLKQDALNTLANVRTPGLLVAAAAWYDAQGYPITAQAIRQKLSTLIRK